MIFTFRTFPFIDELSPDFVLGKLKDDLKVLCSNIKPGETILGVALNDKSYIEPIAINKFNDGTVVQGGLVQHQLSIPDLPFTLRSTPTTTFCNYAAYYIINHIKQNNMDAKIQFVHISEEDFPKLKAYIQKL